VIPKEIGIALGYIQAHGEAIQQADGVGGSVDYLLRNIEMIIDSKKFLAPIAWLQTEACEEILLGRESVFDLFDIEFKQADETIIFKYRTVI